MLQCKKRKRLDKLYDSPDKSDLDLSVTDLGLVPDTPSSHGELSFHIVKAILILLCILFFKIYSSYFSQTFTYYILFTMT